MPLIRLSVTQKLSQDKQDDLLKGLGEAISIIPGKEAHMLIVDMQDDRKMYLGGVKQENMVFADVQYFSNFKHDIKKDFTAAVFSSINRVLGTSKDRMFLTITERNTWGGFGDFVDEYYSD